ncbi:MAG TPA: hypothetical protein VKI17_12335 [Gemmataceae bacterium]|nr:hypothetical protein [Gemmataceae bacterium]
MTTQTDAPRVNTTQELGRMKDRFTWALVAVLVSVLLSISGAILGFYHTQTVFLDNQVRAHGERLTALEVEQKNMAARLIRIEGKLDQVLEAVARHKD